MRKDIMLLMVFVSLLLLPTSLWAAQEPVGSVIALRGGAQAYDAQGKSRPLSLRSPVFEQDELKTSPGGRMQVMFKDNTIVSLGRGSSMKISTYVWNPKEKTGAMHTKVKEGVFRVMGGAITKQSPQNFTTETPAATIGIRGSMYAGKVSGDQLMVVFEGGKGIHVTNGTGSVDISHPGFGTYVGSSNQPPRKPKRFSSGEISDLNTGLGVEPAKQDENEEESPGAQSEQENVSEEGEESTEPQDEQTTEMEEEGTTTQEQEQSDSTQEPEQDAPSTDEPPADDAPLVMDDAAAPSATETEPVQDSSGVTDVLATTGFVSQDLIDTSTSTLQDNLEDQLNEIVQGGFTHSGAFLAQRVLDGTTTDFTTWYSNQLGASFSDGIFSISGTDQYGHGFNFGFNLAINSTAASYVPPFDAYGNLLGTTQTKYVDFDGVGQSFDCMVATDNLGEFVVYGIKDGIYTNNSLQNGYREVGFVGLPSDATLKPTNGIDGYWGMAMGVDTSLIAGQAQYIDAGLSKMFVEVNWLCGKAIGRMKDDVGETVFFFADVTGNTLTNMRFFGYKDFDPTNASTLVSWIEGIPEGANFYGSSYQGIGISGLGQFYDIASDQTTTVGSGRLVAGAFKEEQEVMDITSPTGSISYQGFLTGRADDMNDPQYNRRLFMNNSTGDFTLFINRDAGTVSGSLSASDQISGATTITNLDLGGSFGSAFVLEDNLVAIIGDTGSDAIVSGAYAGGIKPHGNYLISGPIDEQPSDYVTWGYWEISYVDPQSGAQYHVHRPGSYWVAGELTPDTAIAGLASGMVTGTYNGFAKGIHIDTMGAATELTGGSSAIIVDFSSSMVSGNISFNEATLNLTGGYVSASTSTFSAQVSGASTSTVQGAFFGPSAQAIGGSFHADISGNTYMGIFGGNGQF